jgi:hypothetical protein
VARAPSPSVSRAVLLASLSVFVSAPPGPARASDCVRYEDQFRTVAFRSTLPFVSSGVAVDEAAQLVFVCGYDQVAPPAVFVGSLDVYSIRRPEQPDLVTRLEIPVRVDDVVLYQDHLFLLGGDGHLVVVDVTNPRAPHLVGIHDATPNLFNVDIEVSGGFAYAATFAGGLLIYDVTNPNAPVQVGHWPVAVTGVHVEGPLAYLTLNGAGKFAVLDVSDPSQPVQVGGMGGPPGPPLDVTVGGGYAYFAWSFGVKVADLSGPQPVLVAEIPLRGAALDVHLAGSVLFVSTGFEGVIAVDVTDPTDPVVLATAQTPDYAQDVAVVGEHLFVADRSGGLQVIRKANLRSVTPFSSYVAPTNSTTVLGVATSGDLAVVLEGTRLEVLDLSVETASVRLGGVSTAYFSSALAMDGTTVYLPGDGGFEVFDLSDPAAPVSAGSVALPGYGRAVRVSGGHAFVLAGSDGLQVIDVSDPADPRVVTSVDVLALPGMDLEGDHAFLLASNAVDGSRELVVVDVRDPAAPAVVGRATMGPPSNLVAPRAIDVDGGIAYVAYDTEGLRLFDVSDPTAPRFLRSFNPPATVIVDVKVTGNLGYLTTDGAFLVYDVGNPRMLRDLGGATAPASSSSGGRNVRHLEVTPERVYAVLSGSDGIRMFPPACAPVAARPDLPTGVRPLPAVPVPGVSLAADGRNPSGGPAVLRMTLPARGHVEVTVHDAAGRRLRTLANGSFPAGPTRLRWDGRDDGGKRVAAGVYFVSAKTGSGSATRKVVRIPE